MDELETILTEIFNCPRSRLYLESNSIVFDEEQLKKLDYIISRRARSYPLEYILGFTDFMGLRFKVNKNVFIPRPETEILVEAAIQQISTLGFKFRHISIVDIGTGAGNIAISLAKFLTNVQVVAVDISPAALEIARENALINKVEHKIKFLCSDLFSNRYFAKNKTKFEIIVSNPPYVSRDEMPLLEAAVKKEPMIALDGGKTGLDFYFRLSKVFKYYLKNKGLVILEIGYNQAKSIRDIFREYKIDFVKDYQNIERVCIIKRY